MSGQQIQGESLLKQRLPPPKAAFGYAYIGVN